MEPLKVFLVLQFKCYNNNERTFLLKFKTNLIFPLKLTEKITEILSNFEIQNKHKISKNK